MFPDGSLLYSAALRERSRSSAGRGSLKWGHFSPFAIGQASYKITPNRMVKSIHLTPWYKNGTVGKVPEPYRLPPSLHPSQPRPRLTSEAILNEGSSSPNLIPGNRRDRRSENSLLSEEVERVQCATFFGRTNNVWSTGNRRFLPGLEQRNAPIVNRDDVVAYSV